MADTKVEVQVSVQGDGKATTGLKKVEKGLDKVGKEAKETKGQVKGLWKSFLGGQVAFAGLTKSVRGVVNVFKDSIEKYKIQERSEFLLQEALKNTGDATEATFKKFKNFASELQQMTTIGDEASMELMQLGLSMGISKDGIEDATKKAIGLSKAFKVDLNASMKMVTLATQGEYTMLQRYIPEIRTATTSSEKMALANRVMAEGFKIAQAEGETFTGKLDDISNTVGDMQEKFGKAFADAMMPHLKSFHEWLKKNEDKIADFAKGVSTFISELIKGLGRVIKFAKDAFNGVKDLIGLITKAEQRAVERRGQGVANLLADRVNKIARQMNIAKPVMEKYRGLVSNITDAGQRQVSMMKLLERHDKDRYRQIVKNIDKGKEVNNVIKDNTIVLYDNAKAVKKASEELKKWKKNMQDVDYASDAAVRRLEILSDEVLPELGIDIQGINEEIENMIGSEQELTVVTEDMIRDFIMYGNLLSGNIGPAMMQFGDKITKGMKDPIKIANEETEKQVNIWQEWEELNIHDKVGLIERAFSSLNIELGSTIDTLLDVGKGFLQIASGDILGGITGLFSAGFKLGSLIFPEKAKSQEDIFADIVESEQELYKWAGLSYEQTERFLKGQAELDDLIGENFAKMAQNAELATREMFDMMDAVAEKGIEVAEIQDYINKNLKNGVEALKLYSGKFETEFADQFASMLQAQGTTLKDIVAMMGEKAPEALRKFVDENSKVLDNIEGLKGILDAFGNTQALTIDNFKKIQNQAFNAFKQMTEGGEFSEEALQSMIPFLKDIIHFSDLYGFSINDNIQALIDQANAAGISLEGQKSATDAIVESVNSVKDAIIQLAEVFKSILPQSIGASIKAVDSLSSKARGIGIGGAGSPVFAGASNVTNNYDNRRYDSFAVDTRISTTNTKEVTANELSRMIDQNKGRLKNSIRRATGTDG